MKVWFSLAELAQAALPDLPADVRGFDRVVLREGWRADPSKFRRMSGREGGGGYEYHISLLPDAARQKLAFMNADQPAKTDTSRQVWAIYERLTKAQRAECQTRLKVLVEYEQLVSAGIAVGQAIAVVIARAGISMRTFYNWGAMVEGHARQDWLAALAPSTAQKAHGVVPDTAECHPMAWDVLASDYLRLEGSAFSACYRRMVEMAKIKGWAPIPHERTLRRRMDETVPKAVQILCRKGKEEARRLHPAQQRSVAHLHAMQYANTDGHKLDIHVRFDDGRIGRLYLVGIQDLYSRKILSWVLTEAETWEAVRTVVGNMVERHGIPERLYMDNGKAFASKKISGRAKSRHRFKITEDEVAGLLHVLGIDARFVKPKRGQSKPIERGWGDLAENISKHPDMAGAYTGRSTQHKPENYGQRAVSVAELEAHVARCIEEHNARVGRKTEMAKATGKSFDQVFAESMETHGQFVRFASPAQRSLWMLAAEDVTARKPDGAIHLFGNRYWAPLLNQWIGKKLTVRFDPSNLHGAIKVYDREERLLGEAECIAPVGFDCQAAAREKARAENDHMRTLKAEKAAHARLTAVKLRELNAKADKLRPLPTGPKQPVVTRLIPRSAARPLPVVDMAQEEADQQQYQRDISAGLARLAGAAGVIPFPERDSSAGVSAGRKRRTEK